MDQQPAQAGQPAAKSDKGAAAEAADAAKV
jgi:hypothetical protein